MDLLPWLCAVLCASAAFGSISVSRTGWLERAVSYYRKLFLDDVEEIAPIEIKVRLERALPPGAKLESEKWDYASVERLLTLMGASDRAAPVRRALNRVLRPSGPTRRFISKEQSWKLFPSLGKNHPNNIYYDFPSSKSSEEHDESEHDYVDYDEDHTVLVLENPVEARLPSSMITVKVLRDILEARALAARQMPSTTRSTIPWIPMNKTSNGDGKNGTDKGEGATGDKGDVATGAGGDATTAAAGAEPATEPAGE